MWNRWSTRLALGVVALIATSHERAHADITRGSEFEMNEGVAAFTVSNSGKKTMIDPKVPLNERFLCSTDPSPISASWPLVSFTHDMGWGAPTRARTLEIVTGPIAAGDAPDAQKQSTLVTNFYRYLSLRRTTACDDSVQAGYCFVSLKDIEEHVAGLEEDCGGDFPAEDASKYNDQQAGILVPEDDYSEVSEDAGAQTTIGITTADLITVDADKLFSKHTDGNDAAYGEKLFTDLQTKIPTAFPDATASEKSLLLYSLYSMLHFYENSTIISLGELGTDKYHAPKWKNAFALYPKTSVHAIMRKLRPSRGFKAGDVYDKLVKDIDTKIDKATFRELWLAVRNGDFLEQAKPSRNLKVMLFEVRDPAEDLITITNGGDKDAMTVSIPALPF